MDPVRSSLLPLFFLACAAASCGEPGSSAEPRSSPAGGGLDPRRTEVLRALDAGLPDAAWTLLDQLGDSLGIDGPLLRARAALLDGDAVGALRAVEEAKRLAGDAPPAEILATEVEVLVSLDRLDSAREKLREAWKRVGRVAALERARGLLLIRTPGGGREGLTALEAARELDPELPFLDHPTAQAHHLVGRAALASGAPDQALAHALLARAFDGEDLDFRELEAEARAALLDFDAALALYRDLLRDGRPMGETLALMHQRFGTLLLMEKRREEALDQYVAARDLGLSREALGFGATLLAEEAVRQIDLGIGRWSADDLAGARAAFERATACDPANLEARHHLGLCLFREQDFGGAAAVWSEVRREALAAGASLPDPVHLNLARALRLSGDPEGARGVLSEYLDREPEGEWSEESRDLLLALEVEALARED